MINKTPAANLSNKIGIILLQKTDTFIIDDLQLDSGQNRYIISRFRLWFTLGITILRFNDQHFQLKASLVAVSWSISYKFCDICLTFWTIDVMLKTTVE